MDNGTWGNNKARWPGRISGWQFLSLTPCFAILQLRNMFTPTVFISYNALLLHDRRKERNNLDSFAYVRLKDGKFAGNESLRQTDPV